MWQFVVQLETLCKKNFDDHLIKIKPKVRRSKSIVHTNV